MRNVKQLTTAINRWDNGVKAAPNLAIRLMVECLDHIIADGQKTPMLHLLTRTEKKFGNRFVDIAKGLGFTVTLATKDVPATVTGIGRGWNGGDKLETLRQLAKEDASIFGKEMVAAFPRPERKKKEEEAKAEAPGVGHNNPPEAPEAPEAEPSIDDTIERMAELFRAMGAMERDIVMARFKAIQDMDKAAEPVAVPA